MTDPTDSPHDDSESRIVFMTGDVNETLVKSVMEKLFELAESNATKPIHLIVNTYGGSVDETFALYDAMRIIPAPVHTVGLGKIMSAGCLILAAGVKGERKMGRNSRLMYHAGFEVAHGDIFAVENHLVEFKRTERLYDELTAKECNRTVEEVEALYKPARLDKYMDAAAALAFGFVDKIVP